MIARKQPTLKEKNAALIIALFEIPHEHAKQMHTDQINELVQYDHYPIRHADGGTNHPSNLRPLLILAHREKTAKHDAPDMAHERKVRKAQEIHKERLNAKFAATDDALKRHFNTPLRGAGFRRHPDLVRGVDGKVKQRRGRR